MFIYHSWEKSTASYFIFWFICVLIWEQLSLFNQHHSLITKAFASVNKLVKKNF